MPMHIMSPDLYNDHTVQNWHRSSFPSTYMAIDLDLMGVCRFCKKVLYLIESTTRNNKPTTILVSLAKQVNSPAFVIVHDTKEIKYAIELNNNVKYNQEELEARINSLRELHNKAGC